MSSTGSNEPGERTRAATLALTFATTWCGWAVGLAYYVGWSVLATRAGYVTDLEALRGWSALYSFLAWLLGIVPLALWLDPEHRLARFPVAPLFGAICGMVLLWVLLLPVAATPLATQQPFGVQAALTGAIAWGTFCGLRAAPGLRSAPRLFAAPFVLTWMFIALGWPLLERATPGLAYQIADTATRGRLFESALRGLRVGDSLAELRARLPGEFRIEPRNASGRLASGGSYRLDFAAGRAARVEIRD